jgi:DNA-binding HxlR family transcriptional regulator
MVNKAPPRHQLARRTSAEIHGTSVYVRDCPARVMLNRLADKWTVLIIGQLATGTMRFAVLRRAIDGVSQKMLTSTLRDLERDGLVKRQLYASVFGPRTISIRSSKRERTSICGSSEPNI